MATAFYQAGFEKQLTGSTLGGQNCGAASGAMLADQASLGLKNPTPDQFRRATGDYEGGLYIFQIATALERTYGVPCTPYDRYDNLAWSTMFSWLKSGRFMVVGGDYDAVPYALRGDKDFHGLHNVFFHRVTSTGIVVGDPLNDGRRAGIPKGYVTWPTSVARAYVEAFPGGPLTACVMDLRRLRARSGTVNVRAQATRASAVLGTISGTTTLAWGGTVSGESIAGNAVWYRVWHPASSRIGYCHSSVIVRV